jgi:hypothetical protein
MEDEQLITTEQQQQKRLVEIAILTMTCSNRFRWVGFGQSVFRLYSIESIIG